MNHKRLTQWLCFAGLALAAAWLAAGPADRGGACQSLATPAVRCAY